MDGELARLSDRELERLAYGRASTPDDQARAVAAGEELARRADQRARDARLAAERSRELDASPLASTAEVNANRPWWRRPLALVAAGILVLGAMGAAAVAVLAALHAPPPAFAIFERDPVDQEVELRPTLRSGGHLSPTGPRVLAEAEYGTVVAWLPRPAGTVRQTLDDGITPVDGPRQVCVGVIENDPVARELVVSEWRCSAVSAFAEDGLSLTLTGLGGTYDIAWSPEGVVQLDAFVSPAQAAYMEPGFRRVFLPGALPPVPFPQDTAALVYDQSGYIDTSIRLITPMSELVEGAAPDELIIAFTGRPVGVSGLETACLAVIDDVRMHELACADENAIAARTLELGLTRGVATFAVTWSREGEIDLRGVTPR